MAVVTRRIGIRDSSETTLFWSAAIGLALLSAAAPWWWTGLGWGLLGLAIGMGVIYAGGQYLLVIAYGQGHASMLAPFSYARVLMATALGAVMFGELPDRYSLGGIAPPDSTVSILDRPVTSIELLPSCRKTREEGLLYQMLDWCAPCYAIRI